MKPLATRHLFNSDFMHHAPCSTLRKSSAFTLIELLIVIAIIAILAGLGFPAVQGALGQGKKAQARNDVQQLAAAVKAYQLEYGRLPTSTTSSDNQNEQWIGDNKTLMEVLTGGNTSLNPRKIAFLEPRASKTTKGGLAPDGKFYDPWGSMYMLKLDTGYDNRISYYSDNPITSVIVISTGPDTEMEDPSAAGSDDIVNYK